MIISEKILTCIKVHAELSNQCTLLEEETSIDGKTSDSVDGLTLIIPLVGLTDEHIWYIKPADRWLYVLLILTVRERDVPIDNVRLCLPIHVNLHVSTCVDLSDPSDTKMDVTEGKFKA